MGRTAKDDRVYRQIDQMLSRIEGRVGQDRRVWGGVFDRPTVMALHRLLRNNVLETLDYPVSTGKEADVFKATDGDGQPVAVKVYRTSSPTFQRLLQYVEGDPRFRSVPRDHRALIHAWAAKEYRNLERFRDVGVDVPIPFRSLDNVIVMEFLAQDGDAAHTMKQQPPVDPDKAFEKVWSDYRRLIEHAQSVHADLSEYNCLMQDGTPRLIDVGQAVLTGHPMAREFMVRDVGNLARYFAAQGVELDVAKLQAEADGLFDRAVGAEIVED